MTGLLLPEVHFVIVMLALTRILVCELKYIHVAVTYL